MFPGFSTSSSFQVTLPSVAPPVTPPIIAIHMATDLSEWTSTVTDSGDLSWSADAGLGGTTGGMSVLIDDTTAIYGQKTVNTNTSGVVRFRLYIDPNTLTMAENDRFNLVSLFGTSSAYEFGVLALGYAAATGYRLRVQIQNDTLGIQAGTYFNITDAPHYVEVEILRATGESANDGSIQIWIDGTSKETLSGVDNYTVFGDFRYVRAGAPGGIDAGTSGTFYLDELVVNDDGSEIGA